MGNDNDDDDNNNNNNLQPRRTLGSVLARRRVR